MRGGDGLRAEIAFAHQTVQAFRSAGVGNVQARHGRTGGQAGELFIERHQRHDVIDALIERQLGILKGILVLRMERRKACQDQRSGGNILVDVHGNHAHRITMWRLPVAML